VFHPEAKLFFNREGKFSQLTSAEYIARASGKPADDEAQCSSTSTCRRSTIVNLEHVDRVEAASDREYRVWLRGVNAPVSMSRRYAAPLRERPA
jgi:LytTr DNA-binding domain